MKYEFYLPHVSKAELLNKGFRYSRGWSSDDCDAYIAYFPVYRYLLTILLDARIVIYLDGTVRIDIIDKSTKGIYATYYHYDIEHAPIIDVIDTELTKVLNRIGVKKKHEKSRDKAFKKQRKNTHKRFK